MIAKPNGIGSRKRLGDGCGIDGMKKKMEIVPEDKRRHTALGNRN
jgi:hypothetical protein